MPIALTRGMRTFLAVWSGQLVSLVGSEMTGFALGVWVLQKSGSVTQFALISLFLALPGILIAPIAGVLVDRWDRRTVMIMSDVGSGLCTLALAILFLTGQLVIWHIYLAMAFSSVFGAFQWPAFSAATTMLVPKEQLGRAGGMTQLAEAVAHIGSPLLGGTLMLLIGVGGVMLIDVTTLVLAVTVMLCVRIPRPRPQAAPLPGQARPSLWHEVAFGWRYVLARRGLLALLVFFAVNNTVSAMVQVLFTPLVLGFTTPVVLGAILSVGGIGFLVGGLAMSVWGGPPRKIHGILGACLLQGGALLLGGLPPSPWLLGMAACIYFLANPIINGCSQAIWQRKVDPAIQGRVFAVRRMIAWSARPVAYLAAGPLADKVFEPWMAADGLLAPSVGRWLGVGPGRGVALLFLALAAVAISAAIVAACYPRLRRVELELPDATPDTAPAE